jgi:H+/Cl- antiporter ClcA
MTRLFPYLFKIVAAILISAPIAVTITLGIDYVFDPSSSSREISEYLTALYVYPFFYLIYYVILGIPVTLLTDFVIKAFNSKKRFILTYLISLTIYTIAGLVLSDFKLELLDLFLIPIYVYLHVLLFLRRNE